RRDLADPHRLADLDRLADLVDRGPGEPVVGEALIELRVRGGPGDGLTGADRDADRRQHRDPQPSASHLASTSGWPEEDPARPRSVVDAPAARPGMVPAAGAGSV